MTAHRWQATGDVRFERMEGFPCGLLAVKNGSATLHAPAFGDGTIAFDIKLVGQGIPGIRFRQRDADTAEEFYLRPGPDCAASNDCIQYAPQTHGAMLWDLFPRYQARAPVRQNGWNHIRMVLSGRRMNVYVNDAATPTLVVGRLEGDALAGGLQLRGPATFANLTMTPDATDNLSPVPLTDPTDADPRLVRRWSVSAASILRNDAEPTLAQMPADPASWTPIAAERNGLVNLSRRYRSPADLSAGGLAWLTTSIPSDRDQQVHASIGWAREIWVFQNGRLIFSGRNLYNSATQRKPPDGRLSLENGAFALPLRRGANPIVVALSNNFPDGINHYGWGLELRLDDLQGAPAGHD